MCFCWCLKENTGAVWMVNVAMKANVIFSSNSIISTCEKRPCIYGLSLWNNILHLLILGPKETMKNRPRKYQYLYQMSHPSYLCSFTCRQYSWSSYLLKVVTLHDLRANKKENNPNTLRTGHSHEWQMAPS